MLPQIHQPYKPHSGIYAVIILQGMLIHTIQDDSSLFHCKINQPLGFFSPQSDHVSSSKKSNEPISSHRWIVILQYIIIFWTAQKQSLGKHTKGPKSYHIRSFTPNCSIKSGLPIVSFLITRNIRCNYGIFPEYFSHSIGWYYPTF